MKTPLGDSAEPPAAARSRRIHPTEYSAVLATAIKEGILGDDDDAVLFYDLDRLQDRIVELQQAFPVGTLHTLAVKANPSVALLQRATQAGMGVEVASTGEMALADAASVNPASVVFDSPAKTAREITAALRRPLLLNANSRAELLRIAALSDCPQARVGLRVNPTIGVGSINNTSTATVRSKFGVPIADVRSAVAEYCKLGGRLDALHVHVGSQGMSLEQLVLACRLTYDLFADLRETISSLTTLDIGGGLPAAYSSTQVVPSHIDYAAALRDKVPELWSEDLSLVTEFGRSMHANNGWVASRVEYVLPDGVHGGGTLVTHVGADLFVRTAYQPEAWQHEVLVLTCDGDFRVGKTARFNVAGPLCFSGDYLARDVKLPADVTAGDYLIVRDSGAYTAAMWSVYNSRQMPKGVGYSSESGFALLTQRESIDSLVSRWKG